MLVCYCCGCLATQWPLTEFVEYVKAHRGDKSCQQRRVRKARWRAKGLSVKVMEEKLRQKKIQQAAEKAQAEKDRIEAEAYAKAQEEAAAQARLAREAPPPRVNAKLEALRQRFQAAAEPTEGEGANAPAWSFAVAPAATRADVIDSSTPINPAASKLYSTAP
jgi:hypothetical protein